MADVQAAPPPPVDEYVSDSTVGSDDDTPATSRKASSKVTASRCTRQTTGKIAASQAATQIAEAKNRRGKWTRSAVSAATTMMSSDFETIDVEDDEGDVQSPKATTALSPAG
jgi:conjugal transfer/entry exclusion protein